MPTLNINVSQETLDKIESLGTNGITKKMVVDVAIEKISIDSILDSIKQKSKKNAGKKKSIWAFRPTFSIGDALLRVFDLCLVMRRWRFVIKKGWGKNY